MRQNTNASGGSPPKIVWLGDDFTGAAAVMEVLTFSGIPSILFLDPPTPEQLSISLAGFEAFGIATLARSQSPEWMDRHLPSLFAFLDATKAELVHYKICSTLDSSPSSGSIGRAIDLAIGQFGAATVPVVTAAPQIGRYQAFGNLFCSFENEIYRLDRHPVMARHPITPMNDADVARHLAHQTDVPVRCLNLDTLSDPVKASAYLDKVHGADICTLDCLDTGHERAVGGLLWDRRKTSRFIVGSQGIEYALVAHWIETGAVAEAPPRRGLGPDPRMAVVSGSVSLVNARQIAWARDNGFATIRLNAMDLFDGTPAQIAAENTAIKMSLRALDNGLCPLIFTAQGPDDPEVGRLRSKVPNLSAADSAIGRSLGRILKSLVGTAGLRRVAVSGGDTSGHVCSELGLFALEAAAPTVPGAAIFRARSENEFDGLEIALKGGQMGTFDYFGWVRDGGGDR